MIKQPMFSPRENPLKYPRYFDELRLPLLLSPKLDGIRCLPVTATRIEYGSNFEKTSEVEYNVCKSRTMIDLPSRQVQTEFSHFIDLDGELIEGNETDFDVCNRTQSYVMSEDKYSPNLKFRVFDVSAKETCNEHFEVRLEIAMALIEKYLNYQPEAKVSLIEHHWVDTLDKLLEYEDEQLKLGYEGIMWRSPFGPYKYGRGTWKEGYIGKLKRFQDDEGILVGIEQGRHNTNLTFEGEMGQTKRSYVKDGMIGSDLAGTLLVDFEGEIAEVAPGTLTHDERRDILANPQKYIGKLLSFRHFPHGAKTKFRQARFANWRDRRDM